MALIGLGQNGAALELEWSGVGSFKKRPDAVRFGPEIKIKKWAEPWVRPAPGCGLVNPHSVIPFFPIPASTAAALPLLRRRPSAGTLLLLHRSTITAPPPPCVASPWSTAQRRTPAPAVVTCGGRLEQHRAGGLRRERWRAGRTRGVRPLAYGGLEGSIGRVDTRAASAKATVVRVV
jgi:hypothetical protein